MQEWADVRRKIQSLTDAEKDEVSVIADLIAAVITRRNEMGLSQRDLAAMTGLKQSAISRFETVGNTPNLDTLLKIIRPLGLRLELQ